MITIAKYRNLMSAELAKTRLAAGDIPALIADEFSYTLGYGAVMDGVRLQVLDDDAERAKEILAADEFAELPEDHTIVTESPESEAHEGKTGEAVAADTTAGRYGVWLTWLLFLLGIIFLILGRPDGDWSPMHYLSGQFVLLGELLILAALWIAYGRLNTAELPSEHTEPNTGKDRPF